VLHLRRRRFQLSSPLISPTVSARLFSQMHRRRSGLGCRDEPWTDRIRTGQVEEGQAAPRGQ
jgi:hypothetical protein